VPESQTATVQRGNVTVDVTASGNLAYSHTEDLAFEVAGTVKEVLVQEGDTVEAGKVLAQLDTTPLEQAVQTAKQAVATQELNVKKAEQAVMTAQQGIDAAESDVETVESAVKSAEIDLEVATNAYYKLTNPYVYTTYKFMLPECVDSIGVAQARIDDALAENQKGLLGEQYSIADVTAKLLEAQQIITDARTKLAQGLVAGARPDTIDYWTLRGVQTQIDKTQMALDNAKRNLDETTKGVDTAKDNLDIANANLDITKSDWNNANDDLTQANDDLAKATIKAPFAGFITAVNVKGGDEIYKGTVAVQLSDPTKFEADVLVSEMDISQIKLGGQARVQVDALPAITLPAAVTSIAPTATIEQGVVNYQVTIGVQSLQPVSQNQSGQSQTSQSGQEGQTPSTGTSQTVTLRQGLSVTVTIPILERDNVLLVPNRAITRQGKNTVVQVLKNGVIETRTIKTGVNDLRNTEVTDGLSEGEQVVLPQATTTTTPRSEGFFGIGPGR
jgi:HlyD family secretion protein